MNKLIRRITGAAAGFVLAVTGLGISALPAHASTPAQYIGIPSYWSPNTTDGAAMFDRMAQNAPTLGITIINGPTSSAPIPFNQATATAIQKMHQAGEKVLALSLIHI